MRIGEITSGLAEWITTRERYGRSLRICGIFDHERAARDEPMDEGPRRGIHRADTREPELQRNLPVLERRAARTFEPSQILSQEASADRHAASGIVRLYRYPGHLGSLSFAGIGTSQADPGMRANSPRVHHENSQYVASRVISGLQVANAEPVAAVRQP